MAMRTRESETDQMEMERPGRPPSPAAAGATARPDADVDLVECCWALCLFARFYEEIMMLAACVGCCECMASSGLCNCCLCLFHPFLCAWKCLLGQFGYKDAAQYAVTYALQCVQFWTPLSVTFLVLWLLYRPDRFHPTVDDAVLAALDLDLAADANVDDKSSSLVRYDLSVGLSFRNSHSRLSIRYLDVGATAFYNRTKLGSAVNSLPSFRQPPKNTTVWRPAFQGAVTAFPGEVAAQLGKELAAGVVHLRVGVYLTLMYKVWPVKDVVFYKYDCWLWFSPPRKDAPALFHGNGTQCWRV